MPTLHLLHGLVGSGKTTLARRLEQELGAVRFSSDEWMVALYGHNPPDAVFRPQLVKVTELIWLHAGRVLRAGVDVVLEEGFWTRASRDEARRRARELGVSCRLYRLECPIEVARARVLARNQALPSGTLEITSETFDWLVGKLEPLGPDEEHIVVTTG